jgi:RHS repeat-associated protein
MPVASGLDPSQQPAAAALSAAPSAGCASGSVQPVEIATLAAALKCDPDLIFEYVYNNIEYEPLFGSNKGALGTLLDQRGNDIDQAQLFTALLSAAGFSPSQLNYQYGYIRINGTQASGWLGVRNDAFAIANLLANGGIPLANGLFNPDGSLAQLDVAHVWVQVQIGGTMYVFDPSFKQHSVSTGLANLGSILGYTQTQFLADAGGTIDSVSISNINRTAIRNDLVAYAGNLINYIKQNNPAWTVHDVIGGKTIQYLTGSPLRQAALPYLSPNQPSGFPQNWGATIPNAYRTCFAITLPPLPQTPGTCTAPLSPTILLFSDQTYGHRITVFSVSDPNIPGNFIPTLLVNGLAPAGGTSTGPSTAANQSWPIFVAITHPYAGTAANQSRNLIVRAGGSYLIGAGWGQVGRGMVEKHRNQLAQALAAPNANPASEQILGESLAVIGYHWLAQSAAQQRVGDRLAQVTTQYHHGVGIVGQSTIQGHSDAQGPFVDLPLNFVSITQQTCWPQTPCPFPGPILGAFFTSGKVTSSLESAVLEQTQAPTPNMVAASTIRLIDVNAATSAKTFFADGTSAAGVTAYQGSIRPSLVGSYSPTELQAIDNAVFDPITGAPTGQLLVIPANGGIQVGLWQGAGYTIIKQTSTSISITQKISGGLSGGASGTNVPVATQTSNTAQTVEPPPVAAETPAIVNVQTTPDNPRVNDPVDAVTGVYVYKRTDFTTGGGAFPYSLPFGRSYRSSSSLSDLGMGKGWTHSYGLTATPSSEPYEAMGEGSPISAAAVIAAIYVGQDLLGGTKDAQKMTIAAIVARWLTDQLTNNAVLVAGPETTEQFLWLPHADNSATVAYNPPPGSAVVLTASGTTYTYTGKDRTVRTFVPATAGARSRSIASFAHPNGTSVGFGYDGSGKLSTVANNLGRTLTLAYSGPHVSTVTDDTGRSVAFTYDAANNLTSATDPLQFVTSFAYDGASRLTQIFYPSSPGSAFVTNSYDALGRISQQANAFGNAASFYLAGSRTEFINPAGDRHVTYQSPRGKIITDAWMLDGSFGNVFNDTAQQNGVVNVARNQYDGQDRLVLATAPEGGTVAYAYSPDLEHNVIQVTQTAKPGSPLAPLIMAYTYDPTYNKPTSITDPRGLVTTMSYDGPTGNLLSIVADAGSAPHFNAKTSFTYNDVGQVVTATDPVGTVTLSGYGSFGNRTSITRDYGSGRLNQLTTMSYSAPGDVTSVTDPNGNVTTNVHDAARQLTTVTSPGTAAAPSGVVTGFSYDRDGRIVQTQQSANGAVLRSTSATYTLTGKPATATDANGNVTRFAYDLADRLASVTDAEGRVSSYAYDAMSRRTKVLNTAVQINPLLQQGYTPDGLLGTLTDANSNSTSFAYDGFDRLATATYPGGGSTETFSYDANGNVLTRKTRANATIAFAYDTLDRLITKTPPSPAPVVSYGYDLASRLTSVSDTSAPVTAALPPAPNTRYTASYAYDSLNQPTNVTWDPAPAALAPAASSVTFSHAYNRTNQRTAQSTTDSSWWFYPTGPPSTLSYTANALNQYTAVGAVTPTYDGNGNLTSDGTFTYGYDSENRLTSASGAGNTASYSYDGQGRRKLKTVDGTTTVFVTDADNRDILEYDGASGQLLRWHAYGLGANDVLNQMDVVAVTRATFIPDLQGSIIATLDSGSGALSKIGYSPYGRNAGAPGAFGYTGQRLDAETGGLYYYRARHYSPVLGRFLQPDPIGTSGASNLYAYVGNDPLNATDPSGLVQEESGAEQAVPLAAAAGGASGGGGGDGDDGKPPRKPPGTIVAAAGADEPRIGPEANRTPRFVTSRGRLGSELTRQHVADIAAEMESRGWTIAYGGGRLPEEYLPGPGRSRTGSSFPDITATKNGRTLRVNTVDTYADGVTPTAREATNAARIRSQIPGDHLLLVPKTKP